MCRIPLPHEVMHTQVSGIRTWHCGGPWLSLPRHLIWTLTFQCLYCNSWTGLVCLFNLFACLLLNSLTFIFRINVYLYLNNLWIYPYCFHYKIIYFYFLNWLIYFDWRIITLQYCDGFFAIHQHESVTGIHVSPASWTPW